jgi:hypothetical protein
MRSSIRARHSSFASAAKVSAANTNLHRHAAPAASHRYCDLDALLIPAAEVSVFYTERSASLGLPNWRVAAKMRAPHRLRFLQTLAPILTPARTLNSLNLSNLLF